METPGVMHACEFSLFEMVTGGINVHRLLLRDLDPWEGIVPCLPPCRQEWSSVYALTSNFTHVNFTETLVPWSS